MLDLDLKKEEIVILTKDKMCKVFPRTCAFCTFVVSKQNYDFDSEDKAILNRAEWIIENYNQRGRKDLSKRTE